MKILKENPIDFSEKSLGFNIEVAEMRLEAVEGNLRNIRHMVRFPNKCDKVALLAAVRQLEKYFEVYESAFK